MPLTDLQARKAAPREKDYKLTADRAGRAALPDQQAALTKAQQALDQLQPEGARDLRAALDRNPDLSNALQQGRSGAAIQAMALEREICANPSARADRFVDDWKKLGTRQNRLEQSGDYTAADHLRKQMGTMAQSLERDPQIESLLRQRGHELGMHTRTGIDVPRTPAQSRPLARSRHRALVSEIWTRTSTSTIPPSPLTPCVVK